MDYGMVWRSAALRRWSNQRVRDVGRQMKVGDSCYRRDCTRMTVARSAAFTGDGFSFGS